MLSSIGLDRLLPRLTLILVCAIPLGIAPGLFLHYDLAPKTTAACLAGAAALLWITCAKDLRLTRPARVFLVLLAAQASLWIVATTASVHPAISIGGSTWRQFGLIPRLACLALHSHNVQVSIHGWRGNRM
jgi:hypothetical protein